MRHKLNHRADSLLKQWDPIIVGTGVISYPPPPPEVSEQKTAAQKYDPLVLEPISCATNVPVCFETLHNVPNEECQEEHSEWRPDDLASLSAMIGKFESHFCILLVFLGF